MGAQCCKCCCCCYEGVPQPPKKKKPEVKIQPAKVEYCRKPDAPPQPSTLERPNVRCQCLTKN